QRTLSPFLRLTSDWSQCTPRKLQVKRPAISCAASAWHRPPRGILVPQRLITHDGKDRAEHDHKGGPGDDTGMARHEAIAHGLHQGGEDEIHHAAKSGEPAKRRDEHPPVGHPKIM